MASPEMGEYENSSSSKVVSLIAFCGFGLLVALSLPLWWNSAASWLHPLGALLGSDPWAVSGAPNPPSSKDAGWSDAEVKTALMQCLQAVAPITADLAPVASLRNGECGTPAPVLLSSVGSQDKVVFDPPLFLNCPMVVALHGWLKDVVQPAAKEAFGLPIAKLIGSSYACRTVYNEPNGRLSQHAFANAVDLPIFILADGRKIDVTHGWGPAKRDLVAAAKAGTAPSKAVSTQRKSEKSKKLATADLVKVSTSQTAIDPAKAPAKAAASDPTVSAEAKFLRLVLRGACQTFSTVLGPEANDVHRTHFHLDLQERNAVNVCK
jgi:hypothetical protein